MNHAVGTAGQHDVRIIPADDLGGFTECLAGSGTGGQAIQVGSLRIEQAGQMGRRHVGLQLQFEAGIHGLHEIGGETLQVHFAIHLRIGDQVHELHEVLLAFTGTQIDAELGGVVVEILQSRVIHRLHRGSDGVQNVSAGVLETRGVVDVVPQIVVLHFSGELGGELEASK